MPPRWIKIALSFGDRSFEKCLSKVHSSKCPNELRLLGDDGALYYDMHRALRAEGRFIDALDNMSRIALIDQIKLFVRHNKNMMKRIDALEKLILRGDHTGKPNEHQSLEVKKRITTQEKKIISKQFDEAFNITPPNRRLNKTFHVSDHSFNLSD